MDKLLLLITLLLSMANGSELVDYKPFSVDTTQFAIPKYPLMANVDSLQKELSKLDQEFRYFYKPTGEFPEKIWTKLGYLNDVPEKEYHYSYKGDTAYSIQNDTCIASSCRWYRVRVEQMFVNVRNSELRFLTYANSFLPRLRVFPGYYKQTSFDKDGQVSYLTEYHDRYDDQYNLQIEEMVSVGKGRSLVKPLKLGRYSSQENCKIMRYIRLTNDKKKHYDSEIWVDCFDKNKALRKKVRILETLFTPKYLIKSYTYTPDGKIDRIYHYSSKKNAYTKVELNTWDEQGQLRETHFYKLTKAKDGVYNALENKIIKKEYDDQGRLVHEVELVRKD